MKNFDFILKPKTLKQCILADAFRECINNSKSKYSINADSTMKQLYSDFVNVVYNSSKISCLRDRQDIIKELKSLNITCGADIKSLLLFIRASKNDLFRNTIKKISFGRQKEQERLYVAKNSRIGLDTMRTIVVRSKYGTTEPLFYELNGSTSNNHEISLIKQQYHEDTGCDYYQARPILLSTWDTLDEVHKQCTCVCDCQD